MPENPTDLSSSAANIATVKRYAPPNQRNRPLNRRKSGGDRFERMNMHTNDGKNQAAASRNVPVADRVDAIGSNLTNENPRLGLITLHGCCKSEAFQLLNARWAAAINAFNDPSIDLAERPVMYPGSGAPAWGNSRLPHQELFLELPDASPPRTQHVLLLFSSHQLGKAQQCSLRIRRRTEKILLVLLSKGRRKIFTYEWANR